MGIIPILPPKDKQTKADPILPQIGANGVDGFSELTQHAQKRQMEDDLVTALDVEQTYRQWQDAYLDHPETGFLARRGADAKGGYEAFQAEAERKYLELNDGLENSNQRALFGSRIHDHFQWSKDRIAAHEAREGDVHRRTALGEASVTEARRAVELIGEGDTAGADEAMDMARLFLDQSLNGMPTDQQDEARRMLVSGVHGEVFNQRLSKDPIAASQYLFVNQKAIDPVIYERLQQKAQQAIETTQGRELFNSVYAPDLALQDIFQTIDARDTPDSLKPIAKGLATEQRETEQAEKIGFEKQQIQAIEQATHQAVQLIDDGTPFEDLPNDVMDSLPLEHRRAVRTVYMQKISGQRAANNTALENHLHEGWIKAINGDDAKFLSMPLAQHLGSHNRERLALWTQRQAQLNEAHPKLMAEYNRRKLAMNISNRFVGRKVEAQGGDAQTRALLKRRLNEATTNYIFNWHDAHPGQLMELTALLENLEAIVGAEPLGRTSQPYVDDFVALNDQPEGANTDTEQGTQAADGRLPDAVVQSFQGLRMDERGIWYDKDGNALTDADGNLIRKDGKLLTGGDGKPVGNSFRDPNFQKVGGPAFVVPPIIGAAGGAVISGLAALNIITEAQRKDGENALGKSEKAFDEFLADLAVKNPLVGVVLLTPRLLKSILERSDAVDPELKKPLPGTPIDPTGGKGIQTEGFPDSSEEFGGSHIEMLSDESDDLGDSQIETFPDQSDEFGGPQILDMEIPKELQDTEPTVYTNKESRSGHIEDWNNGGKEKHEQWRKRNLQLHKTDSYIFKRLKHYKGKTFTNGLTGKKKRFFEWDVKHGGEIEVFNRHGKHIGVMEPMTGKFYKSASKDKKLDVSLNEASDGTAVV